jgi:hypothetical protein
MCAFYGALFDLKCICTLHPCATGYMKMPRILLASQSDVARAGYREYNHLSRS